MDVKGEVLLHRYNFFSKQVKKWDQNVCRAKIFLHLQSN